MKKRSTNINEEARAALDITRDEYALCQYALYRSADPRMKKAGWCSDGRQEIADFVGITPRGLYKMIHKLSNISLIEIDAVTGFIRAASVFIDAENQKSIGTKFLINRNKVPNQSEQSSEDDRNKVPVQYRGIDRVISKSKNEGGRDETASAAPAPEKQLSTLEAISPLKIEQAAGAGPRHSDKPRDLETDTDLFKQIGEYYKANPNEWTDGVCQVLPGRYNAGQLKSMLEEYSGYAFAWKNKYATFAQHHAEFKRWVKRQPTMQKEQAAQPATDPTKNLKRFV